MKEFLVKYQYLLPLMAGALLAGMGLYYLFFDSAKVETGSVLILGALLNFYLGIKMKPEKEE